MNSPADIRFLADVMLGRLARWLRVLGYDTTYQPDWPRFLLPLEARRDGRVLLTRSKRLIQDHPEVESFLVSSHLPREQLKEVFEKFQLGTHWMFSRCTLCNQLVEKAEPGQVKEQVPKAVFELETSFYRCPGCGRVYWEGSHLKRFREFLRTVGLRSETP